MSQGATEQAASAEEASSSMEQMASTSEELSSQAEQLQETIAFFKIDLVGSRPAVTSIKPRISPAALAQSTEAIPKPSSGGLELDMRQDRASLDQEFERF